MTLDEVTDYISQDLEDWQKEANRKWLKTIWGALKMGAIWYYPLDASMWKKTEEGFDRIMETFISDAMEI